MKAFVDASIIVAILGRENDWRDLTDIVDSGDQLLWSAMSRWESVVVLIKRLGATLEEVREIVDDFAVLNRFTLVPIGADEAAAALAAFERYGKGTGHPAQLNMGDCFAYACARTNGARLLYKGDDFSHTDLA